MSDRTSILIYGCGGHGREVAGIATAAGYDVVGFLDDDLAPGDYRFGQCVGAPVRQAAGAMVALIGIGDPQQRRAAALRLEQLGYAFPEAVIHPAASIGPRVELGEGVVVGSCSSVTADVVVGCHSHLHSSVVVSHDCSIGSFCLLAPHSGLAGGVVVGDTVFVGVGATISPGVTIGRDAVIGAGSAVIRDVTTGITVAGVPARALSQ